MSPEQEAEIVRCYHELRWSQGRVAWYMDRSASTVRRCLIRHGIPLRPASEVIARRPQDYRRPNGAPRKYDDGRVLAVQAVTCSTNRTALLLGMPVGSVKNILRRARLARA